MRIHMIFVVLGMAALQGCGAKIFVSPKENPIIEDKIGDHLYRTMATTSERRIVIVNDSKDPTYRGLYCAEPSPDSADNLASSFSAYLKASQTTAGSETGADGSLNKALATTVQQLGQRTQGLQLFRDGSYSLCQAYMNGILDRAGYINRLDLLLKASTRLIDTELRFKDSVEAAATVKQKTPQEAIDEQREQALKTLQSTTAQQAEKDKFEAAKLSAEVERRKAKNAADLEAAKARNALLEEKKRHELAVLNTELEIRKKQAELDTQKKPQPGDQSPAPGDTTPQPGPGS